MDTGYKKPLSCRRDDVEIPWKISSHLHVIFSVSNAAGCLSSGGGRVEENERTPDTSLYTMSLNKRDLFMDANQEYYRAGDFIYGKLYPQAGDILSPLLLLFSEEELDDKMAQDLLSLQLKRV